MRMPAALLPVLLSLLWLGLLVPTSALGQTTTEPDTSLVLVDQWTRTLDLVEQQLERADTTAESARRFLDVTARVRKEALEVRSRAEENITGVERRLNVLGPAPEVPGLSEAEEVAGQRQELNDELKGLKARLAQANLAIVRTDELDRLVGALSQAKRFEALFRIYPFPWAPETWTRGVPEFVVVLQKIARSPVIWWETVADPERRASIPFRVAILLVIALAIGWVLRLWIVRRYGRDPELQEPSYSRRLVAAIASAVGRGIVPALIFGGLFYLFWANRAHEGGLFWSLVTLFFVVGVFFSLAWALPYAVLSPDLPQWRLLPVSPDNARVLGRRFTLIAALFAIEIFMTEAHHQIGVTDTYFSLATFFLNMLPALVMIDMSRPSRWLSAEPEPVTGEEEGDDAEPAERSGFWRIIQRLVMLLAAASILASFLGYADLGDFLLSGLLLSAISLGGLFIFRGLARETVAAMLRSRVIRDELQIRHVARRRIKFWLRVLLDAAFAIGAALIVASIWFSPFGEIWTDARSLLSGVTVGGVTISVTDILAGVAVFALVLILTRVSQRFLRNRILPETGFDSGVQNSLTAGLGYVGIILAAMIGISTLGIDLSNIALIAGALSVGIGFGLQTIVSNFVSGIILLIERPIKVGDWIVIGPNEGTVKKITVRSTEVQTFQRASVIIPNSDLISNAVVNWTHKDLYGRIEVPVGVAYGSDIEKVKDVLLGCAARHERVLTSPEPFVLFMNFGNSSLDFELRCFTNDVMYRLIISSDLRYEIDRRFREEGIEIPFPQTVVHFAGQPAEPLQGPTSPSALSEPPGNGQPGNGQPGDG